VCVWVCKGVLGCLLCERVSVLSLVLCSVVCVCVCVCVCVYSRGRGDRHMHTHIRHNYDCDHKHLRKVYLISRGGWLYSLEYDTKTNNTQ